MNWFVDALKNDMVLDSQPGDNEYGPNPKAVPVAAAAAA